MVFATVDRPGWESTLEDLFSPRRLLRIARRHYVCRHVRFDWRSALPTGFDVRDVDERLLSDEGPSIPDHIFGWIENNWGTPQRFFDRGFGRATVCDGAVVSWSLSDCRCGPACEIGIQTLPAFRRQGLATITAAAAAEHALTSGYDLVGWHCHDYNLGSIGTAEKVGFELERQYESLYGYASEAEELAEMGWIAFREKEYGRTVDLYRKVFELQPDAPDYKYHLAALACSATGQFQQALAYLDTAIDRGWRAAEYSAAQPEFQPLHGRPEWRRAIERMSNDSVT
jgi:RimJ/RimL family protein N-acetyltransferase